MTALDPYKYPVACLNAVDWRQHRPAVMTPHLITHLG